jgi:hypothetical protein
MGTIWLTELPDWLSAAGLRVDVWPGWQTRSRSSGGYEQVLGIGIHHDASSRTATENAVCAYAWSNAQDRPIGAIRLNRDGHIVVGAAGATNTMGRGGPLKCSKGTIAQDKGNLYMVAIEAANTGVGEEWSTPQLDAYIGMVHTLCDKLGLAHSDVFSHAGYCQPSCPGRKIDPAGPTPGYPRLGGVSGARTWADSVFRFYLDQLDLQPKPPPEPGDDDMDSKQANQLDQVHTIMSGAFWPNAPAITDVMGGELATRIRNIETKLDQLIASLK